MIDRSYAGQPRLAYLCRGQGVNRRALRMVCEAIPNSPCICPTLQEMQWRSHHAPSLAPHNTGTTTRLATTQCVPGYYPGHLPATSLPPGLRQVAPPDLGSAWGSAGSARQLTRWRSWQLDSQLYSGPPDRTAARGRYLR